ncbi:hypothetical protein FQZ97_858710 [compost metagenome]
MIFEFYLLISKCVMDTKFIDKDSFNYQYKITFNMKCVYKPCTAIVPFSVL